MRRRLLALAAAGLVLAAVGPVAAQSPDSILTRVKQETKMRVCFAQGSPESYKDPRTGEWLGVFVELVNRLAEWMKVEVETVEVQWNTAVLALQRGDCDFFGSSFVYNAPRALEVNFITPFRSKGLNAVIRKDNTKGLETASDLDDPNVRIAVGLGSREYETAKRLFPQAELVALQIQADVETLAPTRRGDTDVTILPIININWWLAIPENAEWGKMAFPGEDFGNSPVGWAVAYGDQEWKDFLDMYVRFVQANNVVTELYDEYRAKTNPFAK